MKNKKYLSAITSPRGVCVSIGYYADTSSKNYRIYYCGSDTGARYEKLGNASRCLKRYCDDWEKYGGVYDIKKDFATVKQIPRRGSNA